MKAYIFTISFLTISVFLLCSVEEPTSLPGPGQGMQAIPPGQVTSDKVGEGTEQPQKKSEVNVFEFDFKYTQEEIKKSGNYIKIAGSVDCAICEKKYKDRDMLIDVLSGRLGYPPKGGKPPSEIAPKEGPSNLNPLTRLKTKFSPSFEILVPKNSGLVTVLAIVDIEGDGARGRDMVGHKEVEIKDSDITGLGFKLSEVTPPKDQPITPAPPEKAVSPIPPPKDKDVGIQPAPPKEGAKMKEAEKTTAPATPPSPQQVPEQGSEKKKDK